MSDPTVVTIGMPVRNGAAQLELALTRLAAQSFRGWRLVVSDNASTDATWEILEQWASRDARIEIHRQPNDLGMVPNFRWVLERARTEFFMWHAHDDWLEPSYLEELLGVLQSDPRCGLACGAGIQFGVDGAEIREVAFPALPASRSERVRALLLCHEPTWFYGLYRTDVLRRVRIAVDEFGYTWSFDTLTLLALSLEDRIRGTNETAFHYRRRRGSPDRPGTAKARARFLSRYLRFHLRLLRESEIPRRDALRFAPWVLRHFNDTTRSLVARPVKRALKSPVRAIRRMRRDGS